MTQRLLAETITHGRARWLRFRDLPCSRTLAYKMITSGQLVTVKFFPPGSKKGIVLIDANSLDAYLEKLAGEQRAARTTPDEAVS